jgi:hypothetical protein
LDASLKNNLWNIQTFSLFKNYIGFMRKYLIVVIALTLILVGISGCTMHGTYDTWEIPAGSNITQREFYKDKSDCEFKDQVYLQQGMDKFLRDWELSKCMMAYKRVTKSY